MHIDLRIVFGAGDVALELLEDALQLPFV